ncbi:hypothetical protein [Dyella sp. A6]|uniref:hypothetical protein n=1 Tax=Dyella aluminiiresistens TaxID=3069105 RepID=UPI002E78F2FA|nr:hypothetical protein [Dyella sp. A6]
MQFLARRAGVPENPTQFMAIMLGSALIGLLVVPLYMGYLQVIGATEQGLPARARDIFKPYRHGEAWQQIGYGALMLLIYYGLFAIPFVFRGHEIISWWTQLQIAQIQHQPPPSPPAGFGTMIALYFVIGFFVFGVYAISLGQVALRRRNVFGAIGDGVVGALKNLLPLIALVVGGILAMIVAVIIIAILAIVIIMLGKLAGMWLTFLLMIPLYIALILAMQVMLFGVMYGMWRSVCGDDTSPDASLAIPA